MSACVGVFLRSGAVPVVVVILGVSKSRRVKGIPLLVVKFAHPLEREVDYVSDLVTYGRYVYITVQ